MTSLSASIDIFRVATSPRERPPDQLSTEPEIECDDISDVLHVVNDVAFHAVGTRSATGGFRGVAYVGVVDSGRMGGKDRRWVVRVGGRSARLSRARRPCRRCVTCGILGSDFNVTTFGNSDVSRALNLAGLIRHCNADRHRVLVGLLGLPLYFLDLALCQERIDRLGAFKQCDLSRCCIDERGIDNARLGTRDHLCMPIQRFALNDRDGRDCLCVREAVDLRRAFDEVDGALWTICESLYC